MADSAKRHISWRSARRCGNVTCVEVAKVGNSFLVRDSKNPQQRPLQFSIEEWAHFADAVKSGEFDFR